MATTKTNTPGIYHDETTGSYFVSFYYKDFEGKRHRSLKRGFATIRQAKQYKSDFLAKMEGTSSMLFSSLAKFYIEDLASKVKPITLHTKSRYIDAYFLPTFQDLRIENIGAHNVRQWQLKLLKSLAPSTVKNLHAQLSSIFRYAMRYYGLKNNPCLTAGNISGTKTRRVDFWTVAEFNLFIDALNKSTEFWHAVPLEQLTAAYNTLFYTGVRVGELLALTVGDFDYDNKIIYISKTSSDIKGQTIITEPKTKKSNRAITIPEELSNMLKRHTAALQDQSTEAELFPRLTRAILKYNIDTYSKAAGIKRLRIHDLRHSHASLLVNMGVPIFIVSERLGHNNIQVTIDTYSHLYPKTASDIAEQLNAFMVSK